MRGLYCCILFTFYVSVSLAQSDGDYRSRQTGDWNSQSTWQIFSGGSWQDLENAGGVIPSETSGVITIMDLTTVTIPNGQTITADQIEYENNFGGSTGVITVAVGGTLVINNGAGDDVRLLNDFTTFALLEVYGTLQLNAGASIVDDDYGNIGLGSSPVTADTYKVHGGGTHIHATGAGVSPIPAADWQPESTCQINATSGAVPTIDPSIIFHHFVWNGTNQSALLNLNAGLRNIDGDLTVTSTGGFIFQMATIGAGYTLNIGRDLIIQGDSRVQFGSTTSPVNINVGRDLNISSTNTSTNTISCNVNGTTVITVNGDFNKSNESTVSLLAGISGSTNLILLGNFSSTGGTITRNATSGGTATITFRGNSTRTFLNSGSITNAVNFTIETAKTLNMGTSAITGTGTFTLNGTLGVGSDDPQGALQVYSATASGNLQNNGPRIFASNSTVVYNGSSNQFIGDGFPSQGGDVNLTINTSNNSTVTLSDDLDIVALRTLSLLSGNLVIGNQTLTINGTVTGTGGIIGGPTSNMVIGGTDDFGTLTFNGTNELLNLTINRTNSGLVTLGGSLTIRGTLTHTNGTLAIQDNTLTIRGDYGPSTPANLGVTNLSTVIIEGEGTVPDDVSFSGTELGTLTIDRAGASLTTTSTMAIHTLNLYSGIFNNGAGISITAGGTIKRRGGASGGSMTTNPSNTTDAYNVTYEDGAMTSGPELPTSTTALADLLKSGTGIWTLGSDITVNGTLSLTNGTFQAGSHTVTLKQNLISTGASTFTSALVVFAGTTIISGGAPPTFGNIEITGTVTPNINYRINGNLDNTGTLNAGTGSVTFGGTTVISGGSNSFNGLTIASGGSLTAPAGSISVAGNFANSGTFIHNGGTVNFTGTSSITGTAPTFNHVIVSGTLNAPASLNLAGNLNVNGTFVHNSGTVTFNGTGVQSLNRTSGSGPVVVDLYNVTVDKTANTFFVESTVTGTTFRVANQFVIARNGTATTDVDFDGAAGAGTLVLRSTSTRTASIPAVPASVGVSGNITVERFIANSDGIRSYRYLAPPVIGSTVDDWQDEVAITGQFLDPSSGAGILMPNNPSLYRYVETNGGAYSNRYEAYPNNATLPATGFPLANGTGYAVYMYNSGTPTLNSRGTLRIGDFPVGLTATGVDANAAGFNLVGNPYPAPIDWDLVALPAGVSSTISLKDNVNNALAGTGNFVYYVKGGPNVGGFTGVIASGQAFWVETTQAASLTFMESHKVSDSNPVLVRERSLADVLRIRIDGNGRGDESVIWLHEEATDEADLRFDAKKKTNDFLNLYTFFEAQPDVKYAINGLGDFGCSKSFRLAVTDINSDSVNVVPAGTYILNFSDFDSFTKPYHFSLIDKFKNEVVDIRENPEYSFQVTADPRTFGENRFEVLVSQPDFATDNVIHYNSVCENAGAAITIENSDPLVSYSVKDNDGQTISSVVQGNGNSIVLSVSQGKLVNGINNLRIFAGNGLCEAIPLQETVKLEVNELYKVSDVQNGRSCNTGSVTLTASGVPSDGEYVWYESELSVEPLGTGFEFATPELNKSKTYYVAARNALGCEGPRVQVKADVVNIEPAIISPLEGGVLASNYTDNIQWYFNDQPISGATNKELVAEQSGIYTLEAKVAGCVTSAQYDFLVTALEEGFDQMVRVYPNPVASRISVELKNPEPASAVVVNSVGNVVGAIQFVRMGSHQRGELDFGGQAAGLYLIKITQGKKSIHYKIIKE